MVCTGKNLIESAVDNRCVETREEERLGTVTGAPVTDKVLLTWARGGWRHQPPITSGHGAWTCYQATNSRTSLLVPDRSNRPGIRPAVVVDDRHDGRSPKAPTSEGPVAFRRFRRHGWGCRRIRTRMPDRMPGARRASLGRRYVAAPVQGPAAAALVVGPVHARYPTLRRCGRGEERGG